MIGPLNKNGYQSYCHYLFFITVRYYLYLIPIIKYKCKHNLKLFIFPVLDPLFPMIFLINSWVPGMLDAIMQTTFLCAILMFWLCVYHGLRQVYNKKSLVNNLLP